MKPECSIATCPSLEGNFFQSTDFLRTALQAGWKAFALDWSKNGVSGHVVAFSPDLLPVYSTLFPRFQVFYGPTVERAFDTATLDSILLRLCQTARKYGAVDLNVKTPFPFPYGYEVFRKHGFHRRIEGGECSVLIDLGRDRDVLWTETKRYARRCVKTAKREGVAVKEVETREELNQFYRMYVDTGHRRGFVPLSFNLFRVLWDQLEPKGLVKFFLACWKEKPIAGVLNTFYGKESVPWIACSLDEYWRLRPNHLLFWHSICWSKDVAGSTIFKLYHLPPEREDTSKIDYYSFKTCFGGRLVEECTAYHKYISPLRSRLFQTVERLPKAAARRLAFSAVFVTPRSQADLREEVKPCLA